MVSGGWLLIALTGILALILLLLAAPVRLGGVWSAREKSFSIKYLGLSVEFSYADKCRRVCLLGWVIASTAWPATREEAPRTARTDPRGSARSDGSVSSGRIRRLLTKGRRLWNSRAIPRRALLVILRFLGRVARSWHVEHAEVKVTAGLGNPARTGMATGWFYAFRPFLRNRFPGLRIEWQPRFDEPILEVEADIVLRAFPAQLVYHFTRAVVTFPWRGLWKFRARMAEER